MLVRLPHACLHFGILQIPFYCVPDCALSILQTSCWLLTLATVSHVCCFCPMTFCVVGKCQPVNWELGWISLPSFYKSSQVGGVFPGSASVCHINNAFMGTWVCNFSTSAKLQDAVRSGLLLQTVGATWGSSPRDALLTYKWLWLHLARVNWCSSVNILCVGAQLGTFGLYCRLFLQ